MTPTTTTSPTWIVTCTDLHSAFGPYSSKGEALEDASRATRESEQGCVYLPVEFHFVRPTDRKEASDDRPRPGQYL